MMYICGDIHRPKIIHQNWGFLFRLPRIILSTITIESNWNVWHPLPTFIGRVLKLLFYKKSQNLPQLWLLVMMFKLKKQVKLKKRKKNLQKKIFVKETNHCTVNYISIYYTIIVVVVRSGTRNPVLGFWKHNQREAYLSKINCLVLFILRLTENPISGVWYVTH